MTSNSATLSGTKASAHVSATKGDLKTYKIFRSDAICAAWAAEDGTTLQDEEECRLAMVWIALLAGGDYVPEGIETFGRWNHSSDPAIGLCPGHKIAYGLAKAGLSTELSLFRRDRKAFLASLSSLQQRMIHELRTNSTGQIGRKNPARANSLAAMSPAELFNMDAVEAYMQPKTSGEDPSQGWPGFLGSDRRAGAGRNGGRGDMEGLARACERFFEWGTRDLVVKRFVSESVGTFGNEIVQAARRRVIEQDPEQTAIRPSAGPSGRLTSYFPVTASSSSQGKSAAPVAPTPSTSYPECIVKIERTRPDPTNTELTEYRIQYKTADFVQRVHDAMTGSRVDPKHLTPEERLALGMKEVAQEDLEDEEAPKDKGLARLWIADWLVREAWPALVQEWEEAEAAKAKPKSRAASRTASTGSTKFTKTTSRSKKILQADGEDTDRFAAFFGSQAARSSSDSAGAAQSRSFRRTTSAPSGSSTARSFGTAARGTLTPIGELPRIPTMDDSAPTLHGAKSSTAFPAANSRAFGRTTSSPVTSLGSAYTRGPAATMTGLPELEEFFVDSDDESAPVIINTAASDRPVDGRNRSATSSSAPTDPPRSASSPAKPTMERRSTRISPQRAAVTEVIDICSSSEEEETIEEKPVPVKPKSRAPVSNQPVRILRASSRDNSQPLPQATGSSKPSRSTASARQAVLTFPIVAAAPSATPHHPTKAAARLAATPTPTKIQPKKGRKSYLVEEEDEEMEVIDSTRGGVNLKGYGYNR